MPQTNIQRGSPDVAERGLWRHTGFLKLWASWTVSILGDEVTQLALPIAAALTLDATPAQMGLLGAAGTVPFLLVGLPAGVWVDRRRRRPVLVATDIGRALLLVTIPLAALLDMLTIEHLIAVAFAGGFLNVFSAVAAFSVLPSIVARKDLLEANSKLESSQAVLRVGAPGLAGALIQAVTAPVAIAIDAVSFVASGALVANIRTPEPEPDASVRTGRMLPQIKEGAAVILRNPLLRPVVLASATSVLFADMLFTVYILFLTRDLGYGPAAIGLLFAAGGVASVLSALVAARFTHRIGLGRALGAAMGFRLLGRMLLPLAAGPLALPVLIAGHALFAFGDPLWNINQVSLRQAVTPDHLLGRMTATVRFIVWGMMPVGALVGGLLGELIGLRATMLIGASGSGLALLWLLFSPVIALTEHPEPVDDGGHAVKE